MANRLAHGGALDAAVRQFRIPLAQWLDLSTGINPVPYTIDNLSASVWAQLPQSHAENALLSNARAYYKVPVSADIIASPGTQALIQWLPYLVPKSHVVVLGPTYSEHAHCWRAAGHKVENINLDEKPPDSAGVIIAVNPNNPDGYIHNRNDLMKLTRSDRLLVVDEAFADTEPTCSLISATGHSGLIVLRSFGKFFGLAGARLGFAITNKDLACKLSVALGPWAVSGPTMEIATKAFSDTNWIAKTRLRLKEDATQLDTIVTPKLGVVLGGTDLFRLYKIGNTNTYFKLASKGILTRPLSKNQKVLRFGLPANSEGFQRLIRAIS